jgi:hypothetical protein
MEDVAKYRADGKTWSCCSKLVGKSGTSRRYAGGWRQPDARRGTGAASRVAVDETCSDIAVASMVAR